MDELPLRECSKENVITDPLESTSRKELKDFVEKENAPNIDDEYFQNLGEKEVQIKENGTPDSFITETGKSNAEFITRPRLSILTEFDPLYHNHSLEKSIIEETFPEEAGPSPCKSTPQKSDNQDNYLICPEITITKSSPVESNDKNDLVDINPLDITVTNTSHENTSSTSDELKDLELSTEFHDCAEKFDTQEQLHTESELSASPGLENNQNSNSSDQSKYFGVERTESVEKSTINEQVLPVTSNKEKEKSFEESICKDSTKTIEDKIDCQKEIFEEKRTSITHNKLSEPLCNQETFEENNCNANTSTTEQAESSFGCQEEIPEQKGTHNKLIEISFNQEENKLEEIKHNKISAVSIKSRKSLQESSSQHNFEKKKCFDRRSLPQNIDRTVGIVKGSPKVQDSLNDGNKLTDQRTKKLNMDISDKFEEENSDLKLQLNASQQERASLELEIRQKEEIIIKTQAELIRKEQAYKQEIKQLKQKLEEKSAENDTDNIKELEEIIKSLKTKEARLLSEINTLTKEENSYKKIMAEFEANLQEKVNEIQKLKDEHETVKRHLANLELAFSDVHQKYERSKNIIERYKLNEEALIQRLSASEEMVQKSEEKYDSLKAHAKAQIEKIGKEMANTRETNDMEIHKLQTIIKRLEIKNASLIVSLDQKNQECLALTALCDEVTGKV